MPLRLQDYEDEDELHEELQMQLCAVVLLFVLGASEAAELRNSHRRRLYLCRRELLPNPRAGTPWQVLWDTRSDRPYITTMGVDVATFDHILEAGFAALWDTTAIPRPDSNPRGQPRTGGRSLDAIGALGLYLHYLNSCMTETSLQEIFALIPSTVSRYIRFAQDILLVVLRRIPAGAITYPSEDNNGVNEFDRFNSFIVVRHPLLTGAFGVMDGLNLTTHAHGDPVIENATYNGWLHSHCTSSVFVFSPKGTIIMCHLNAPGSWHDSRVARPIFEKLG